MENCGKSNIELILIIKNFILIIEKIKYWKIIFNFKIKQIIIYNKKIIIKFKKLN